MRPQARLVILAFCFDSSYCQKDHEVREKVCVPVPGSVLNLFFLAPKIIFFVHHNILKYEHNDSLVRTVQRDSQVSREYDVRWHTATFVVSLAPSVRRLRLLL